METNRAAQAQNESHDRPEQIGASIFEGIIFRPIRPYFAPMALNGKTRPVGIEKAKMLSARKQTGAQV